MAARLNPDVLRAKTLTSAYGQTDNSPQITLVYKMRRFYVNQSEPESPAMLGWTAITNTLTQAAREALAGHPVPWALDVLMAETDGVLAHASRSELDIEETLAANLRLFAEGAWTDVQEMIRSAHDFPRSRSRAADLESMAA